MSVCACEGMGRKGGPVSSCYLPAHFNVLSCARARDAGMHVLADLEGRVVCEDAKVVHDVGLLGLAVYLV